MATKPTGVGSGNYSRAGQQPAARSARAREASKHSPWRSAPMCNTVRATASFKALKPEEPQA